MANLPERAFLGILSRNLSMTEIAIRYGVSVKTVAKRLKADPKRPGRPAVRAARAVTKRVCQGCGCEVGRKRRYCDECRRVRRNETARARHSNTTAGVALDRAPAAEPGRCDDWRAWVYGGAKRPK